MLDLRNDAMSLASCADGHLRPQLASSCVHARRHEHVFRSLSGLRCRRSRVLKRRASQQTNERSKPAVMTCLRHCLGEGTVSSVIKRALFCHPGPGGVIGIRRANGRQHLFPPQIYINLLVLFLPFRNLLHAHPPRRQCRPPSRSLTAHLRATPTESHPHLADLGSHRLPHTQT
jgi:hypothetical protein